MGECMGWPRSHIHFTSDSEEEGERFDLVECEEVEEEVVPEGAGDGGESPWREEPMVDIEPMNEPEVPHPPATQTVGIQTSTSGVHFHMEDAYGRRVWGQIFVDTAPDDSRPVVTQESMARVMEVLLPVVEVEYTDTPMPNDAEVASGDPLPASTDDAMSAMPSAPAATTTTDDAIVTCSKAANTANADTHGAGAVTEAAVVAESAVATPAAATQRSVSLDGKQLRVLVPKLVLGPLAALEAQLQCAEAPKNDAYQRKG